MARRTGLTILELVIVLSILAVVASLLFPAIQSAREKAREATCKNNLHQMNLAVAQFFDVNKRLPAPPLPGIIGGWTVDILPYLEQRILEDSIAPGTTIASAAAALLLQPPIMRCPNRSNQAAPPGAMSSSHYVFISVAEGKSFALSDAPTQLTAPWASGPEMNFNDIIQSTGPHRGGLFYVNGFQQAGAGFILNGELIR